ncbi:hypothetical protein [Posidoniimonas corsicana]|nr:hypothetical protein [Posidoniimonas corsicana]
MQLRILSLSAFAVAACCGLASKPAHAQVNYLFQAAPGAAESARQWSTPGNWLNPDNNNMFVPNAMFDERAVIDNGATAILNVSSPSSGESSVVTPGALQVSNGGLDIRSTGALFVTANDFTPGTVSIGGSGVLTIASGGVLNAGGAVTMAGGAAYNVGVTGIGSNGRINTDASASVGGSLSLQFSGYSPSAGDSWTVLEAASISGGFSSVSASGLQFNETIHVSQADVAGGRRALNASVAEVLVLDVNRDTGVATITHPGSTSIQLDGYFVGSDSGLLRADPASWNSFNESGALGNDWVETAQTVNNIGELKIGGEATFGADFNLGAIYDPLAGEFGTAAEDLEFGYRSADGSKYTGVVRYSGAKANTLVLQVDPNGTGDAYLRNTSSTSVQFDAYEVLSASGAISPSAWDSLDDQDGPGNVWLEGLNNTANLISEFDSEGFTTISPGQSWNLGPLFTGGAQDLSFNFLMQGEEVGTAGLVVYEQYVPGVGLAGDFNEDNVVDAADYTVWRDNVGAASLPNDNGLGVVGQAHYELWRSQYGSTQSGPSAAASAPEPAAVVLMLAAAAASIGGCRGRAS